MDDNSVNLSNNIISLGLVYETLVLAVGVELTFQWWVKPHGVVPNYDFIFSSYETTASVQMTTDIIHDDEEDELIVDPDGQGGFGSGVLQGISLHFYGEGSFTSLFDLNFYDGLFETNLGNTAEIQIGKPVSFQIDMNSPSKVCRLNVASQLTVFENERSLAKHDRYLHQSPHKTTLQVVTYDSSILE